MVILGVKIPENKKIVYGLTSIFGIGLNISLRICCELGLAINLRIKDLKKSDQKKIVRWIKDNIKVQKIKKLEILNNIERYKENKSRRGLRHKLKLPVRGQRTHSNGRTAKKISSIRI